MTGTLPKSAQEVSHYLLHNDPKFKGRISILATRDTYSAAKDCIREATKRGWAGGHATGFHSGYETKQKDVDTQQACFQRKFGTDYKIRLVVLGILQGISIMNLILSVAYIIFSGWSPATTTCLGSSGLFFTVTARYYCDVLSNKQRWLHEFAMKTIKNWWRFAAPFAGESLHTLKRPCHHYGKHFLCGSVKTRILRQNVGLRWTTKTTFVTSASMPLNRWNWYLSLDKLR